MELNNRKKKKRSECDSTILFTLLIINAFIIIITFIVNIGWANDRQIIGNELLLLLLWWFNEYTAVTLRTLHVYRTLGFSLFVRIFFFFLSFLILVPTLIRLSALLHLKFWPSSQIVSISLFFLRNSFLLPFYSVYLIVVINTGISVRMKTYTFT